MHALDSLLGLAGLGYAICEIAIGKKTASCVSGKAQARPAPATFGSDTTRPDNSPLRLFQTRFAKASS